MPDEVDFLEMQERLRADTDGSERTAIDERLEQLAARLKRRLDAGVPPAEFARLQALHDAAEAARGAVESAWRRYHPGSALSA